MVKAVSKQKPGYFDGVRGVISSTDKLCNGYRRLLDEDGVDEDYRLSLLGSLAEQKKMESKRKQREKDEEVEYSFCGEEESDPQYELFLGRLKAHGNSYILESLEYDGKTIKYEGSSSSDTECDQQLRRKPSVARQRDGPPKEMLCEENRNSLDSQSTSSTGIERLTRRQTRSQSRSEKEANAKLPTKNTVPCSTYPRSAPALKGHANLNKDCDREPERMLLRSGIKPKTEDFTHSKNDEQSIATKEMEKMTGRSLQNKLKSGKEDGIVQLDPDYHMFLKNLKAINNHSYFYMDASHTVVYDLKSGKSNPVKEEQNDGSYSDVEILDSTTFYKMDKSGKSASVSAFRHKVITDLKRPFDEEELEKLRNDVEVRKLEERHLDLRNGRERSYGKQKYGKSYLDRFPALRRKLLQVQHDEAKCLNLLRGFFLWLKQPDSFFPWLDDECLAVYPESG